ncbi:MAG: nucleotidyltransferase domain-containing protein [Candidatus Pacearchaeota archaeon]
MEEIEKIAKKFNLKFIIIFGSKAKGKEKNHSDLDLAYYPEGDVDNKNLYQDLMEHFKRADIDLIDLKKRKATYSFSLV